MYTFMQCTIELTNFFNKTAKKKWIEMTDCIAVELNSIECVKVMKDEWWKEEVEMHVCTNFLNKLTHFWFLCYNNS